MNMVWQMQCKGDDITIILKETKGILNGITPLLVNLAEDYMIASFANTNEKACFYIRNEDVLPATITFKAGNGSHSMLGDAVFQLEPGQEYIAGPFEEVRFKQLKENKIHINIQGNANKIKIGMVNL